MSQFLRLLQVEDSESDAALVVRQLERAGYQVHAKRLEDAQEMRDTLQRETWDVIIADHHMARLDAPGALRILHETGLDIPFIVVSGSIGEELAVAMMKSGAHDYVLKDNLTRLVPAVERELRDAESRRSRRKAEQDLRESQERLALAIEATQIGTFDYSPQTGVLICSDLMKRHLGLQPEAEVSFSTLLACVHPDDRHTVDQTTRNVLRPGSGGLFLSEYRTVGAEDRVQRAVCSWGKVFFDAAGQPLRFVGVTYDVSERKRLEDQFRHAQKLESLGRLAGGIAHDFNNLLTVINGYSDMLLNQLSADDPSYDSIAEIRTAGERAAALSGQMLVLSRKQVVQPREVNLNDIIGEVKRMLGRVIGEQIRLESELAPSLGCVKADPGQLHQVLMNLSINARDAMPSGGTLRIATRNVDLDECSPERPLDLKPGPCVELTLTDTGVGMSGEVLSHIFEPFFTTKKEGQGTGLGLATAYGIVQQCGGSISVASEPEHGTTFRIYLPRIKPADSQPEEQERGVSRAHGNETVLVVEDQAQVRKMTAGVLRGYGYRVIEAEGPEEAQGASARHSGPIHLLLTDVVMPVMSGPELAARLRTARPFMRVIFMSGYSEKLVPALQMSASAYLSKPFSPDALAGKVRELLDSGQTVPVVLIAADEPQVRREVSGILTDSGYLVLEAGDEREALRQLESAAVSLLITSLAFSEKGCNGTKPAIPRKYPRLKIIAMSPAEELEAAETLSAQAAIARPVQAQDLLKAVSGLLCGQEKDSLAGLPRRQ